MLLPKFLRHKSSSLLRLNYIVNQYIKIHCLWSAEESGIRTLVVPEESFIPSFLLSLISVQLISCHRHCLAGNFTCILQKQDLLTFSIYSLRKCNQTRLQICYLICFPFIYYYVVLRVFRIAAECKRIILQCGGKYLF